MKNEVRLVYRGYAGGHLFSDGQGFCISINKPHKSNELPMLDNPEEYLNKKYKITIEEVRPKSGATVIIDENSFINREKK